MLTCEHLLDFLTDYVENTLAPADRARFDEHLAACPECVDYLHNFQSTLQACRCARTQSAADDAGQIPEQLVQAILAALSQR